MSGNLGDTKMKTHESRDTSLLATLHDFGVTLVVRRDEHHLRVPLLVCIFDKLHDIGTSSSLLAVPKA